MQESNERKVVAIEDLATVFVSEFVKDHKEELMTLMVSGGIGEKAKFETPFLKMSYPKRRKLVDQTLDRIEREIERGKF